MEINIFNDFSFILNIVSIYLMHFFIVFLYDRKMRRKIQVTLQNSNDFLYNHYFDIETSRRQIFCINQKHKKDFVVFF